MKMSPRLIYCAFVLLLVCFAVNTCKAQLVIDNLDGEVTQNEVDTFISVVSATPIPTSEWTATITHNQLADGNGGQTSKRHRRLERGLPEEGRAEEVSN